MSRSRSSRLMRRAAAIAVGVTSLLSFGSMGTAHAITLDPAAVSGYWLDPAGGDAAPAAATSTYYNGNSAKAVVMTRDGKGGFVVDNGGSKHPFAVGPVTVTNPLPAAASNPQTFGTADVVSGVVMMADGLSGYWLDT